VEKAASRATYHHGNLPDALVAASLELIEEKGVNGFSVAEAARRTGVSISAPYRHFADRDELLAACATVACGELQRYFEAAFAEHDAPADQLAGATAAFVRFAAERRSMFEALFGAGLEKSKYPLLMEAILDLRAMVMEVARELVPSGNDEAAVIMVQALVSLARVYAMQLFEGGFGESPGMAELTVQRATAATAALLHGRQLLFSEPGDR
jgi:AcrR family transcriptional regulator